MRAHATAECFADSANQIPDVRIGRPCFLFHLEDPVERYRRRLHFGERDVVVMSLVYVKYHGSGFCVDVPAAKCSHDCSSFWWGLFGRPKEPGSVALGGFGSVLHWLLGCVAVAGAFGCCRVAFAAPSELHVTLDEAPKCRLDRFCTIHCVTEELIELHAFNDRQRHHFPNDIAEPSCRGGTLDDCA